MRKKVRMPDGEKCALEPGPAAGLVLMPDKRFPKILRELHPPGLKVLEFAASRSSRSIRFSFRVLLARWPSHDFLLVGSRGCPDLTL